MFIDIFHFLRKKFPQGEFYIVGGASRDLLLNRKTFDIDIATSLTPEEIQKGLPDVDLTFAKFGTVNYKYNGFNLTLATFRKDITTDDYRHPSKIEFITSYQEDSYRRDFTINAIYLDENGAILDPQNGLKDLKSKTLRMIGDPNIRLKEDYLRIVRAYRFKETLDFEFDNELYKAIKRLKDNIKFLNPQKILDEINKAPSEEIKEKIQQDLLN